MCRPHQRAVSAGRRPYRRSLPRESWKLARLLRIPEHEWAKHVKGLISDLTYHEDPDETS
ncbi:hypothetical protein EB232_21810 [Mesorhizobium sp. NZP2077]|nr:hypothetical protein EB232_21810 [Mesorhizobium sp. NZP2077]